MRKPVQETVMAPGTVPAPGFPAGFAPPGSTVPQALLDDLFTVAYEELRRLASIVSRNSRGSTLSPTALVNEAWVKLARSRPDCISSEIHFRSIAARAMRQVLVEAARRRHSVRHGGDAVFVTFEDGPTPSSSAAEVLALNDALDALALLNPRQATMIEARFFGGLTTAEIARLLNTSEATILRDWRAARAWLARELRSG